MMKERRPFNLVTIDKEWKPNTDSPRDIAKWIWGTAFPGWVVTLLEEKGVGIGATAFSLGANTTPPSSIPLDDGEKIAIATAEKMVLIGAGIILLAYFDQEPTSKLGLLVSGGIITLLGGGGVLLTVILTRKKYEWEMSYDKKTEKVKWKARPIE